MKGLDANATKIEIDIDFIKNDFQITDNGTGISLENLKIIGNRYGIVYIIVWNYQKLFLNFDFKIYIVFKK